ncbi:response regulator [Ottowia testudinis]|uniref:Response regulator n=1 Tax=Ottowia testudinis TaxID=2816950 RepID=A0A975CI78_9BURK|nr:response regulator [Ottowia testudinis]QTD45412.1 response regulator [Ottowia testudinis]
MDKNDRVLPGAGASLTAASTTVAETLKVFAMGFQDNERRLLNGVVLLSQRRNPQLKLLKDTEAEQADAILIDASQRAAMAWAAERAWLDGRTVIWVDRQDKVRANHIIVKRPVQWPALPMILARAMDENARDLQRRAAGATNFVSTDMLRQQLVTQTTQDTASNVLVVDDSLAVRNHLQSLLGHLGLAVTAVDSGDSALMAISAKDFRCVLMDVLMPGMDGYEACRQIKTKRRAGNPLPVIMLTSKSSPFDRIRGKMAGCDAYLTKPVDAAELHTTLSKFLTLRGAGKGPSVTVQPPPSRSLRSTG